MAGRRLSPSSPPSSPMDLEINIPDGMEPCPTCGTSGYVTGALVPKAKLLTLQQETADLRKDNNRLETQLSRGRVEAAKTSLICLTVLAVLGVGGAFGYQYNQANQAAAEAQTAEAQAQIETERTKAQARAEAQQQAQMRAEAQAQARSQAELKQRQTAWNACLEKFGALRCQCFEDTPTPDGSNTPELISRCWRNAALLKGTGTTP